MATATPAQRAARRKAAAQKAAAQKPALYDENGNVRYAKRARKPFLWFSMQHKKTIAAATGLGKGSRQKRDELCAKVADAWKFLTKEQRAPYQKMWQEDKERFWREREYLPVMESQNQKKVVDADAKPKKVIGPYFWFLAENKSRVTKSTNGKPVGMVQATRNLAKEWKKMSKAEKQPYLQMASDDSKRFAREKRAWEDKMKAKAAQIKREADEAAAKEAKKVALKNAVIANKLKKVNAQAARKAAAAALVLRQKTALVALKARKEVRKNAAIANKQKKSAVSAAWAARMASAAAKKAAAARKAAAAKKGACKVAKPTAAGKPKLISQPKAKATQPKAKAAKAKLSAKPSAKKPAVKKLVKQVAKASRKSGMTSATSSKLMLALTDAVAVNIPAEPMEVDAVAADTPTAQPAVDSKVSRANGLKVSRATDMKLPSAGDTKVQ